MLGEAAALLRTPEDLAATAHLEQSLTIGDSLPEASSSPGRAPEPEQELQETPEVIY